MQCIRGAQKQTKKTTVFDRKINPKTNKIIKKAFISISSCAAAIGIGYAVYKIINDVVYIYRIVDARTDYPKLIADNL